MLAARWPVLTVLATVNKQIKVFTSASATNPLYCEMNRMRAAPTRFSNSLLLHYILTFPPFSGDYLINILT